MVWLIIAAVLAIASFTIARFYAVRMAEKRIADFQNDLVLRYYNEVKNMYSEMRGWRHDYRNHIQTLKVLNADQHVDDYLNKLDADLTGVDNLISSGNITLDAILNSKLSLAAVKEIKVTAKANCPEVLSVSEIDICIIVGNLLDNAVEACEKVDTAERFIRVYIDVQRNHLYISVTNAAKGKPTKVSGAYRTAKVGFHGFGLLRVDRTVAKYGGYCYRSGEEGVFVTEITLPI